MVSCFGDKVIHIFCHLWPVKSFFNSTVLRLRRCPILTCSSIYTNDLNLLRNSNCFLSLIVLLYSKLFSSISSFSISLSITFTSLSSFWILTSSILMPFFYLKYSLLIQIPLSALSLGLELSVLLPYLLQRKVTDFLHLSP